MSKPKVAVMDGPGIASGGSDHARANISLLVSMLRSLERFGYEAILIAVDDRLRDAIDQAGRSAACLERAELRDIPTEGERASFLLDLAEETGAMVVSNERFDDYQADYPWIVKRTIPYRVYRGKVYLDPELLMGVF